MVDRRARNRLAELTRHLAAGQISTDDFADEAVRLAEDSSDSAVWAVYAFAGSLYQDVSALWPVRLRGRFRLPSDIRRRLAIAAVFLYSDVEYEWPASLGPSGACLDCLLAYLCGGFVIFGIGFLFLSVLFWWSAFACVGCFVAAAFLYRLSQRLAASFRAKWESRQTRFGEYRVWPFLRLEDFQDARENPGLLFGRAVSRPNCGAEE